MASRSLGVLLIAALGACGGTRAAPESLGVEEQPILGGYEDANDRGAIGVVDLDPSGGVVSICSGALIAADVVLTAHHCVASVIDETAGVVDCAQTAFGPSFAAASLHVSTRATLSTNPNDYHAVQEIVTPPASLLCGNDVALLVLTAPIDASEAKPLVPRVDTPIAAGDAYSAIGYGGTDSSGDGAGLRRRLDGLAVTCVGAACDAGYVSAREWQGEKGICVGDSGGPALDPEARVVGVTSRSTSCTKPVYGDVRAWSELLMETAVSAAKARGAEPPPWATGWPTDPSFSGAIGGSCTESSDCATGHCAGEGSTAYCTRACSAAAPCPSGTTCGGAPQICLRDEARGGCTLAPLGERRGTTSWLLVPIALTLARIASGRLRKRASRRSS